MSFILFALWHLALMHKKVLWSCYLFFYTTYIYIIVNIVQFRWWSMGAVCMWSQNYSHFLCLGTRLVWELTAIVQWPQILSRVVLNCQSQRILDNWARACVSLGTMGACHPRNFRTSHLALVDGTLSFKFLKRSLWAVSCILIRRTILGEPGQSFWQKIITRLICTLRCDLEGTL